MNNEQFGDNSNCSIINCPTVHCNAIFAATFFRLFLHQPERIRLQTKQGESCGNHELSRNCNSSLGEKPGYQLSGTDDVFAVETWSGVLCDPISAGITAFPFVFS